MKRELVKKFTPSELKHFREILERIKAELEKELCARRPEGVQQTPDEVDSAVVSVQMHTREYVTNGGVNNLCNIQAALYRIKEGSFGKCLDCGRNILKKRFAAVPWASLCCKCQEKADAKIPARRRRIQVRMK